MATLAQQISLDIDTYTCQAALQKSDRWLLRSVMKSNEARLVAIIILQLTISALYYYNEGLHRVAITISISY